MLSTKHDPDDMAPIVQGWDWLITKVADALADRLCSRLALNPAPGEIISPGTDHSSDEIYDEPGPASVRKWFERDELYQRWQIKKSKIQELETLGRLPAWRPGPQKVLYFWAYVWACEGRMTKEEADRIFHDHEHLHGEPAPIRLLSR